MTDSYNRKEKEAYMKRFLAVLVILAVVVFVGGMSGVYANEPGEWEGSISLGGTLTSGNTDKSSIALSISGDQRLPNDRYRGSINLNYAKEGDEVTERNIHGFVQADHFITPQVYGYLNTELTKDIIGKDLNLRAVVGPGVGLQVCETDQTEISVEGGLAYFSEDLDSGEDSQWMTTRFAGNFKHEISDNVSFKDTGVLNTDIEHLDDYKFRNEATLSTALAANWNLNLTNIFQYESDPADNVEHRDITTTAALQYNF